MRVRCYAEPPKPILNIHLRENRLSKGLSLSDLHKLSGLSISYLSEVELEIKPITINNLCIIAAAIGVAVEQLYTVNEVI